jgi:hypothetical protein
LGVTKKVEMQLSLLRFVRRFNPDVALRASALNSAREEG